MSWRAPSAGVVASMSLFWVICFFLAYAWFGQYIPGLFRFSGISFPKLMEVLMYGENGIFGSPLVTSLGTLFYFLVFGTFFSNCGGGGVLIDGGMKLSDKTVGGPQRQLSSLPACWAWFPVLRSQMFPPPAF